jgi:hypothetical protein
MRKLLLTLTVMLFATPALADYTLIVPQKPGGGTSQWAQIVATEWEKHLGERIIIKHIPGARDIPGFNKFHNGLKNDDKTIMVSHGGNGVSFLQEKVDYNYAEYDSIGLMNLNIIAGMKKDPHVGNPKGKVKFAAGSGMVPEGLAMTQLLCGNLSSIDKYTACFKDKVTWVPGMSGGQRRLAYKRGELNGTRENPAAFKKHVQPQIDAGTSVIWFHHGILQADGSHADDPNYPGYQFELLFEKRWGEKPNNPLYSAYKLVKSFRDGLQKALWVGKGNPNLDHLRKTLTAMTRHPESIKAIQAKVGNYEWLVGERGNQQRDTLMTFITADALKTLVQFNTSAFGLKSLYKPNLIK